jgi:succinate dehydrogenase / fumarate reductase iron-sulfur subunit
MKVELIVQRGDNSSNITMNQYTVEVEPGSVVLDAVHKLQATQAPDLAVRWNCKAGKCGSCSAEINGHPKLMCMSLLADYSEGKPLIIKPMKTFPLIKDLVTDVSWNFTVNKRIPAYSHPSDLQNPKVAQKDVDRIQEFRKCIECFLCQNSCHILRSHDKKDNFIGPRFLIRLANLEMHPLNTKNRLNELYKDFGIGYCNITKCCTEVCPENIAITDNAIIPLKERVADQYYDPVKILLRKIFRRK